MRAIWITAPCAALLLSACSMQLIPSDNIDSDAFLEGPHSQRCTAVVQDVSDTGVTINDDPMARLTLTVTAPGTWAVVAHGRDGDSQDSRPVSEGVQTAPPPPYTATIEALVSRLDVPRRGDQLDVSCDPGNPKNTKLID
jgi:hypothetical protein